jgi:hypothetical protein
VTTLPHTPSASRLPASKKEIKEQEGCAPRTQRLRHEAFEELYTVSKVDELARRHPALGFSGVLRVIDRCHRRQETVQYPFGYVAESLRVEEALLDGRLETRMLWPYADDITDRRCRAPAGVLSSRNRCVETKRIMFASDEA